ncbi:hypothetical protein [Cupriavidus sp. D384]|uniref:hypothetical protein n=1 Tax=Cupriavidus sp. D384 TaxID=1538095 RepID=UPI00082E73AF|nr:hypothetical protein [Cupriavidus sp. D384]
MLKLMARGEMNDGQHWHRYFRTTFIRHFERTLEALERRILPAFANIEAEATEIQRSNYNELMSRSGNPNVDPFSAGEAAAEAATEAGYDHYSGMDAVRQALLNSYGAILYHAWEQQLLAFHRSNVLHPREQDDHRLLNLKIVQVRLQNLGIDIAALPAWTTLDELRLLANAVKHADGASAETLKAMRPELFEAPTLEGLGLEIPYTRRVFKPLSGEDIYLTLDDLRRYGRSVIGFWEQLAEVLEKV